MKLHSNPLRRLGHLSLLLALCCSANGQGSKPSDAAAKDQSSITQLDPFTVSALFAAIDVRFILSGKNLLNPLADPVESAEVVNVQVRDPDDTPEIRVGDTIVSVDGVKLQGLTLPEISSLLDSARKKGVPTWQLGRLPVAKTIKFDGDWLTPLPSLHR